MDQYVRPTIAPQEFRDADGNAIPYGNRWGKDSPPDDAYSRLTHPERFQPLHDVARALIAHLERTYDVTLSEDRSHLADLPREMVTATSATPAVRLTPSNPNAASITVAFTPHPGIVLRAGALYCATLPVCGCDACDDSWQALADDLEWIVLAMVEGGFAERVTRGPRATLGYSLERADGSRSGSGRPGTDLKRPDLAAARKRLAEIAGPWAAWSPRRH